MASEAAVGLVFIVSVVVVCCALSRPKVGQLGRSIQGYKTMADNRAIGSSNQTWRKCLIPLDHKEIDQNL